MKKYLLLILVFILSVTCTFAQDSNKEYDNKYYILLQKGARLEKNGDYEEAYECYEEAYEISKNILPLLNLAQLQARIGNYDEAANRLKDIPVKKLPKTGQAEVALLLGKIHAMKGDMINAGSSFGDALKLVPDKSAAKIRSAMVKLISGMAYSAEELIANEEFTYENGYIFEDLKMCFALDMNIGNFGRAYNTCSLIGEANIKANPKSGFLDKLNNQPFVLFISFLPLFLSRYLAIFYYALLFGALGLSASALAKKTNMWHILAFVIVGVTLFTIAQNYCIKNVYISILNGYGYIYDGIWIVPRMIIASHLVALALFLIFPCFKLVREDMRPASYELLGIWLFCFFFGVVVLSFQSNLKWVPQLTYMFIGMIFCVISALIMPFSKLVLYKISQITGLSFIGNVSAPKATNGKLSFADTKILENKMVNFVNRGEIDSALALGKKVLNYDNQKSFPTFWLEYIIAQIANEDYDIAKKNIEEYYQVFQGTKNYESCQVYDAWLKTEKGDFPTAYKLVNSISDDRAKSLSADEIAVSLLVLARCSLNVKDNVQAHINFNKAFNSVKSPFFKSLILTEVVELDCNMVAKQSLQKWKSQIGSISNTGKCNSYLNTIKSMIALSENNTEEARKQAAECLKSKFPNGKAFAWYGHLLCLNGKSNEAEELLSRMTAGSFTAECLMTEVTTTTSPANS